jgi:hypothetical protein
LGKIFKNRTTRLWVVLFFFGNLPEAEENLDKNNGEFTA